MATWFGDAAAAEILTCLALWGLMLAYLILWPMLRRTPRQLGDEDGEQG